MEEVVAVGQRLPGSSSGSGGSGGGSSTGGVSTLPSQGSRGAGIPPDPAEEFTQEMHEQLKDCWLDKAAESADVRGWIGRHTDSTWAEETPETWTSENPAPLYSDLMGRLHLTTMLVEIFPKNINKYATIDEVPFDHYIMWIQMEEFVHVLQVIHERSDGDGHYNPTKADKLAMEVEAKRARTNFWQYIFGIKAPFHPPATKLPADYETDRERYNELFLKQKNGTLVVDPDADPPIDEVAELKHLDTLFDKVNENVYPYQKKKDDYDADSLECD